ncbi:MAG: SEL1-like repeat protein, partial [Planctomycetota bacterium]|nr:SEL1-like repeat protein [Planctomycetota bacterium]
YRKSADNEDEDAMYELGNCYEKGLGVKADAAQARKWYRLAAGLGQSAAAERLRAMEDQSTL